ncbi:MAG: hypothetical protein J6066_05445, partial [Lachnospiraceae bacterium]|nr:hypothetical protein [Lachnospiraceae bacterium]
KEIKSIYDFDTADSIKKGDHVIINVQGTIGNAASYVTYDKSTGKTKSEDNRYYILPFFSGEDSTLLTVKVSKKDFKGFEEAEDFFYESDEDFNETFITVEGIVRKLSSEEEKYVNEYCAEFDKYMGTNISIYATNLCVDLKVKSVTIIVSVIGIVLALIGILLVALGIKQGKVDSANRKALAASNYYQAPTNVSFNNDPNAAQQPQAPNGVYNPYGIQNDPRFAGAINNAQATAQNTADQAVTSFNEVKTDVQEAATTSFNEVPISPIADVPPINPENKQ